MQQPVFSLSHFGMLSSLGIGASTNACAMQCGYDGFETSQFLGNRSEPYVTAACTLVSGKFGSEKDAYLIAQSLLQTFEGMAIENVNKTPIIFCLPSRPDIWDAQKQAHLLLARVKELLAPYQITANLHNQLILNNRCAVVEALDKASQLMESTGVSRVVIVTSDNLVNRSAVDYYSGDLYEDGIRLLTEDNPNGFIPGEATVSFMVSKNLNNTKPQLLFRGFGALEEDAIWGSGKVCNAKGLIKATRIALQMADKKMSEMDFILSSASGEDYFFKEVATASTQTLEKKVDEQPLWLPATHLGETGTAVGGTMLVMAFYAMQNGYAPGKTAIGMLSDDDNQRAAFVIEYVEEA